MGMDDIIGSIPTSQKCKLGRKMESENILKQLKLKVGGTSQKTFVS
jgi:hypothetical protein